MKRLLAVVLLILVGGAAWAGTISGTVYAVGTVSAHGKPTVALANLGAGLITSGTHSWKYTFVDGTGETLPSSASGILTTATATNGKVYVTVPALPAWATGANVYRTVAGNAGDYKLVNPSPVLAGDYTDNIADGSLGASAPTTNTTTSAGEAETFAGDTIGQAPAAFTKVGDANASFLVADVGGNVLDVTNDLVWAYARWDSPSTVASITELTVDVRMANDDANPAVLIREQDIGLGGFDAYRWDLSYGGGWFRLYKIVDNGSTQVASVAKTWATNTWYTVKISAVGTALKGKVWVKGEAEPAWDIEQTDGDVTAAGYIGVRTNATTHHIYFDNFSLPIAQADPTEAPVVALANLGAGLVTSGAHSVKVGYITAAGNSSLSAASDAVTTVEATNGKVIVSVVASSNPAVTAAKIYMTKAGGSDYFLVTSVANTTGDTTVNVADASLTSAAPTADTASIPTTLQATSGKRFSYIYLRNNHATEKVFVTLDGADPSQVATSADWIAPTTTYLSLPLILGPLPYPRDGQPITKILLRGETTAPTVTYRIVED